MLNTITWNHEQKIINIKSNYSYQIVILETI